MSTQSLSYRDVNNIHENQSINEDDLHNNLDSIFNENIENDQFQYLLMCVKNFIGLEKTLLPFNSTPEIVNYYLAKIFTKVEKNRKVSNENKINFLPALRMKISSLNDLQMKIDMINVYQLYFNIFTIESNGKKFFKRKILKNFHKNVLLTDELIVIKINEEKLKQTKKLIFELDYKSMNKVFYLTFRLNKLWFQVKYLFSLIISFIFRKKSDKNIGKFVLNIDDITSLGNEITEILTDHNDSFVGSIKYYIEWISVEHNSKSLLKIKQHLLLYKKIFLWHLSNEIDLLGDDENALLKIESINYKSFVYMPGVTLINQHRLQNNLTHYEDGIYRRAILIKLFLNMNNDSDDDEKRLKKKVLLLSLLINDNIGLESENELQTTNYYKNLNKFESNIVLKLYAYYADKMNLLISEKHNTEVIDEFLLYLRLMSLYDKKFIKLNLGITINETIKSVLLKYLQDNLKTTDQNVNEKIIFKLNFIEDKLEKYWLKNICKILNEEGKTQVKDIFNKNLKQKIFDFLKNFNFNDQNQNEKLLKLYSFISKFDFLIGGLITLEAVNKKLDKNICNDEEEEEEQNVKKVKRKPKQQESNDENLISQKLLKNFKFGEISRCKYNAYKMGFRDVFSIEIFVSLCDFKMKKLISLIGNLIAMKIKKLNTKMTKTNTYSNDDNNEEEDEDDDEIDKFAYKALGETLFFFMEINWWNERFLDKVVNAFLEIIDNLCKHFCIRVDDLFEDNISNKNVIFILIYCVNKIDSIKMNMLMKHFIEILTDASSIYIINICKKLIDMNKKLLSNSNENKFKNLNELKNLTNEEKLLLKYYLQMNEQCEKLFDYEKYLLEKCVYHFLENLFTFISNEIEIIIEKNEFIKNSVQSNFIKFFENDLKFLYNNIKSLDNKILLLNYIQYNLDEYLEKQFKYLKQFFSNEESEQQNVTKLQIIRLNVFITQLFLIVYDLFAKFSEQYSSVRRNYEMIKLFYNSDEYINEYKLITIS